MVYKNIVEVHLLIKFIEKIYKQLKLNEENQRYLYTRCSQNYVQIDTSRIGKRK